MPDKDVIMALAKVVIAAAWVDGKVTIEEVNSLKDLLFRMPHIGSDWEMQMSAHEWARLEIYIESPVDAAERARLIEDLRAVLRTSEDRALALSALEELIKADGVVTEEEKVVAEEIRTALESADVGLIGQLGRLIKGPVTRRTEAMADAPNREAYLEAYIKNKVYYKVRQRLNLDGEGLDIRDSDLRKLSLAGGLMARVAFVDQEVTEDEFEAMVRALQAGWQVSRESAALVAEIAVSEVSNDLDYFRLTREFFTDTTQEERISFLDTLFTVAAADGQISANESVEIRRIARSLQLTQRQFVEAKRKFE